MYIDIILWISARLPSRYNGEVGIQDVKGHSLWVGVYGGDV